MRSSTRSRRRRSRFDPLEVIVPSQPNFGLLEVGRPAAGETVLVSCAAGATGSVVGQIARIKGCRAIEGAEEGHWPSDEAGFDAAIDYKSDVHARLKELCLKGIDIFL
jgi:NADPH-dependent curcumin reductase CurA